MVNRCTGRHVLRGWLIAPATLFSLCCLIVRAANAEPGEPHSASPSKQLDELDEVLVSGEKPSIRQSDITTWLRRLAGQFTYEGHVGLDDRGNTKDQLPVQGVANCAGFGPAPAVQCEVSVAPSPERTESGGETLDELSWLNPALMLFGYEPVAIGVRYILVDGRGFAMPALGLLYGDTLISRTPCAEGPADCERVARITAAPDLKVIDIRIDIEKGYRRAESYRLLLRRVTADQAVPTPMALQ